MSITVGNYNVLRLIFEHDVDDRFSESIFVKAFDIYENSYLYESPELKFKSIIYSQCYIVKKLATGSDRNYII